MITPQDVSGQLRARAQVNAESSEYKDPEMKAHDQGYRKGLREAADMVDRIETMTDSRL